MEIKRIFDLLDYLVTKYKRNDMLAVKHNGIWEKYSTENYFITVENLCCGLLSKGISKGDKIISLSDNRPEWNFLDMAIARIGAVHVPVYPNLSKTEYEHIFNHSDAVMAFVSSEDYFLKAKEASLNAPAIREIFSFDKLNDCNYWLELIETGKLNKDKYLSKLLEIQNSISENDLFSIIYTSGTTGLSKGVMLSHKNFISNMFGCMEVFPVSSDGRFLSFLPLCHVFERMVNYALHYKGLGIYYLEKMETIGESLNEIKPQGFCAVPRVLEKLFDKIIYNGKKLKGIKKVVFSQSVKVGLKFELNCKNLWRNLQHKLADRLVFSKWREAFGGNIRIIVSGGATLQPRLARLFTAAGLPVQEGYGLTETSPVIAVNFPYYPLMKFGTVGPVIKNVEVKIAPDNEILMKGPSLMLGYYKDEKRTKKVIDSNGWFHTGDIGELQQHNILKITDRKKEIFKLSTGKYVAPQIIENLFKESPFIEQIMVVGEGEKFASAIIGPSFQFLHDWCLKNKVSFLTDKDVINNQKVKGCFQNEVNVINEKLSRHMQIKKFSLIIDIWLPETGELSPTLKLKRKFLINKYQPLIDDIYKESELDIQ